MISDQTVRERALDPAQSFIVQAPAGSGKTELLTQRYLRLLAEAVQEPEEIVAITFTRKAAAEMRARIVKALVRAEQATPMQEAYEATTRALAEAVLARDQRLGWRLLANHHRLRITTIDSLCASLVRQRPLLTQLGETPSVSELPEPYYQQAVQALLADLETDEPWSQALQTLLLHVDNRFDQLENLLIAMLKRREQWLEVITSARQQGVVRAALEQALHEVREDIVARVTEAFPVAERENLAMVFAFANLSLAVPWSLDDWFHQPTLSAWQWLAEWLLTDAQEWRKTVTHKQGFPAQKDDTHPASADERKIHKQAMLALLERLRGHAGLLDAFAQVQSAPPAAFSDAQWQVVQALVMVLPVLVAHLQVVFAEAGEVDFNEISLAALQALGQEEAPSDVALALDQQVRHWLVDEFQDTSQLQFRLLQALTRGWQNDDGRTLFLVGDPMQSIYRFRQADVGLFVQAIEQGIGAVRLEYLVLTRNFRSNAQLIEWFNREFAQVFPEQANLLVGAVNYKPSLAVRADTDPEQAFGVHWLWSVAKSTAAKVVAQVLATQHQYPEQSMAILVRSRGQLQSLLPLLQEAGIAYQAVDLESLAERMVIQDFLSLTLALTQRADHLSWFSLLRAPWCGLSLLDLKALSDQRQGRTVWQTLSQTESTLVLSAEGQQRVGHLHTQLAPWLAQVGYQPLRTVVEGAWRALSGPNLISEAVDLQNAETFLQLLEQHPSPAFDRALLLRQLAQLKAAGISTGANPVQVMTIHKAKGLEFDTVIIPDLAAGARRDDPPLLLWQEQRSHKGLHQLLLAPIKSRELPHEPVYRYLWATEQQRAHHELERQLYVGLTRAKRRLYLGASLKTNEEGAVKPPLANSFLALLWPSVVGLAEEAAAAARSAVGDNADPFADARTLAGSDAKTMGTPLLQRTASGLASAVVGAVDVNINQTEFNHPDRNALLQWRARTVGTVVHEVLARLATGLTSSTLWLTRRLTTLGLAAAERTAAVALIERAAQVMGQDQRGQWILDPRHAEAYCEWPLWVAMKEGVRQCIIDRTFVADSVRWIVDYKLSEPTREQPLAEFLAEQKLLYQFQLQRYVQAVRAMDAGHEIRAALYFPLVGGWVEVF